MKSDRNLKEMPLGDVGFSMKYEASKTKSNIIQIDRGLWLEIADILMDADIKIRTIERMTKELLKKG